MYRRPPAQRLSRQTLVLGGLIFVLGFGMLAFAYWQLFFGGGLTSQLVLTRSATLTILRGTVQVRVAGRSDFQVAQDGQTLQAGDQIRTAAESQAIVTFFEGTTLQVEPGSDIALQAVTGVAGQATTIRLQQLVGVTWARVVAFTDASSRFEITTPTSVASVRGTVFRVAVLPDPATGRLQTEVQTQEGVVAVAAAGQEVLVPSGQQTVVGEQRPPQPPRPVPLAPGPPKLSPSSLKVTWVGPGGLLVDDPLRRSVGRTAAGSLLNQIPGATVTGPVDGSQTIEIPDAPVGPYRLTVFSRAAGAYRLTVLGSSFSRPIISLRCDGETAPEGQAGADLQVIGQNHVLTGAQLGPVSPSGDPASAVRPLTPRCQVAYRPLAE